MMNRRNFLKLTAASAPMILSASAFGANDRVNVGLIGLGGRCQQIAKSTADIAGMRIAAVCDCFKPRVDAWMANMPEGQAWKGYLDFREMIEKEKLDAVMVETTTHARAWITCHAMAMGMDVYIEKPMCLTIAEGREMVNCARKYKRVTQVGTQQRSMPLNNWASDLVKNGAIGKVKNVLAPNFMGSVPWTPQPEEPMPEGSNEGWWEVWTNQAELRPYRKELHQGWAHWWAYDGGGQSFGVTGWGAHSYDQIQRGLGTDETGPVEVTLEEPVRHKPAGAFTDRTPEPWETGSPYYNMVRKATGPRADVRMRYANGTELTLTLDGDWGPGLGCIFVGENGSIEINRDKVYASHTDIDALDGNPGPLKVIETQPHIENWIDCIRSRKRCTADIEYGHRSSSVCYLVNIARDVGQVGKTLQWDPDAERFTNCDEGNALLARPRREGYELPA